jgi:hypothetical protein
MSKRGQTNGFKASDLVAEITKYAGRKPDVVVQHEGALAEEVLEKYRERGEERIEDDLVQTGECMIVRTDIAFEREVAADKGDTLARSLIRHDVAKMALAPNFSLFSVPSKSIKI